MSYWSQSQPYSVWLLQAKSLQSLHLFATLRVIALQAPLSMGYSRREHRSGLPFPPPGDLPDPGMGPASFTSPALQVGSLPLTPPGKPFSVGGGSERHNEVKVTGGLLEATTIAQLLLFGVLYVFPL